jgi:hypothetical protein
LSNAITFFHNFTPKLRWVGEFNYGKQWGDGLATTLINYGPNHYGANFNGASWGGVMSFVTYQLKPKWAVGLRGEHFKNQSGIAISPVCGWYGSAAPGGPGRPCATNLDEITFTVHYDLNKYIQIGPEVRYDFQDDNHGLAVFGEYNTDVNNSAQFACTPTPAATPLMSSNGQVGNCNAHTHNLVASVSLLLNF